MKRASIDSDCGELKRRKCQLAGPDGVFGAPRCHPWQCGPTPVPVSSLPYIAEKSYVSASVSVTNLANNCTRRWVGWPFSIALPLVGKGGHETDAVYVACHEGLKLNPAKSTDPTKVPDSYRISIDLELRDGANSVAARGSALDVVCVSPGPENPVMVPVRLADSLVAAFYLQAVSEPEPPTLTLLSFPDAKCLGNGGGQRLWN